MSVRLIHLLTAKRAGWLAASVVVSVLILTVVGYRAIDEWQHSASMLAQRRADGAAEQLLTAITRDMRGVQTSVLAALTLDEDAPDMLLDLNAVGSAFARYPYVEIFFAGVRPTRRSELTYYSRTDRMPTWMPSPGEEVLFPVAPGRSNAIDRLLVPAIGRSALEARQFATFDTVLNGVPYQIVAFLRYADTSREDVSSIVGFGVNLEWVRAHYFHDIVGQIHRIQGADPGLALRIADADERTIVATGPFGEGPSSRRRFPLLFFNPSLIALDPPGDLTRVLWSADADMSGDRALSAARAGARRTISIAAASAVALAIGFAFTFQAVRTNARLTTMKSEFMSAVTHELKSPIATIRAAAETLASGRPLNPERSREYAHLAVQESKRLTRLIDNLLAYARITDVTEAYSFELLDAGSLLRHVVQEFHCQLSAADFAVNIDVPASLPPIRADRPAMSLALGNLVDNAIRYSVERRTLTASARLEEWYVVIEVADSGIGIPPHELPRVTHRFFRGESAVAGGSGLGLAIVERIVADHAGAIAISSEQGVGTTVSLKLPHAGVERETAHSDS